MSQERRPRVVVIADWWWPNLVGGAELSARDIARTLALSSDVTVIVPSANPTNYKDGPLTVVAARKRFARRQHPDSLLRRVVELVTTWLNPWSASSIVREIQTIEPDAIVVTNTSRTGPWVLRSLRRRPYGTVRVFHDLSDTCWRRSRQQKAGHNCYTPCSFCSIKLGIMRRAVPSGTHSVCVSNFLRDDLVRNGLTSPEASYVGYPAVSAPPQAVPRHTEEGLVDEIVLGYIGRLAPVKGLENAIDVASRFADQSTSRVSLLVAGKGDKTYVDALRKRAASRGLNADFPGWMDIDEFCEDVDVVLIPSTWLEPFGRVAVEVGMRGLPMLVSPLGGLPEAAQLSLGAHGFADFSDSATAAAELRLLLDARQAANGRPTTGTLPNHGERDRLSLTDAALRAVQTVIKQGE